MTFLFVDISMKVRPPISPSDPLELVDKQQLNILILHNNGVSSVKCKQGGQL